MSNISFLHGYTKDGLNLQGVHWDVFKKDICVICIHGMSGNIIDNYFGEVLGEELSKKGYGFIFGHNRGYSHVNDIDKKDGGYARVGAAYEIFEESLYDIDLWVNKAKELGYQEVILMGHSIGSNKVIYYLSNTNNKIIKKAILASPSDMIGDTILSEHNYEELIKEARNNVKEGNPNKLLNELLGDWFLISSKTFLDTCVEGTKADNLPLLKNPKVFDQLSKIKIPMLVFYGGAENAKDFGIKNRLNIIKEKAINCPRCDISIIPNANHTYHEQENALAKLIINYIRKE